MAAAKVKQQRHDGTPHNLALVHMDYALDKCPGELSGGMKQRVGIARCYLQDSLMEIHAVPRRPSEKSSRSNCRVHGGRMKLAIPDSGHG